MILLQVLFLQVIVAVIVLFVLWVILKRELILGALSALEQGDAGQDVAQVTIISASQLQPIDVRRFENVIERKFPLARVEMTVSTGLYAGLVIQAGERLHDFSLLTRMKHLCGAC